MVRQDGDRLGGRVPAEREQAAAERDAGIAARIDEQIERRVAIGFAARRRDVRLGPDEVVELGAIVEVERDRMELAGIGPCPVPVAQHHARHELERRGEEHRRERALLARGGGGALGDDDTLGEVVEVHQRHAEVGQQPRVVGIGRAGPEDGDGLAAARRRPAPRARASVSATPAIHVAQNSATLPEPWTSSEASAAS